ncbi:ParM/StbA family protein [Oculatella sp. LEGE 06141]|uniref:ParM/StbA family protein n=1 Tax=Oculatella sp. LEGE 06141 TaxID=1828648 RepID=UPI001880296A|nr:ParM/StbA family protein [Oculatella sp. LEGE 06141]MBE9180370.1 ParM/StbA family protein [Oculatella sp. LEGE 06141]
MTIATRQKRSSKEPTVVTTSRVLALDAGNYDLKYYDGASHPKGIRSVRFQLPKGRDAVRYTETSPLVELPDGTRYHFGAQAYKYRRQQQTVVENKVDLTKLHLYACLEPLDGTISEFPLSLYISTPEPAKNAEAIKTQLLGWHEFTRNGIEYQVDVQRVEVEREGMGAYYYAKTLGLIPDNGYTIVVDIGGGTWLTRLVDAEGEVIDENVMDRGGAYELATSISFDRRLTNSLGTTADPSLVMDGFKLGHTYGDTGLTWAPWLEEYLDSWFKGIFQTIKAQYTPYMARVTRFLVTGGSSHLISERLAGRKLFTVMHDPQFANVRGLFLLSNDTQLCMTTR